MSWACGKPAPELPRRSQPWRRSITKAEKRLPVTRSGGADAGPEALVAMGTGLWGQAVTVGWVGAG